MRARAIWCCLWFGLLPGELYEDRPCHYRPGSYARHVFLNLKTALLWIFWREPEDYHVFEREMNPSWKAVWKMMFRPCS